MQELNENSKNANVKGPHLALVIKQEKISSDTYRIYLNNETVAKHAAPGQFVSILCEGLTLRRPFSIADAYDKTFEIIYKVKGKGTNIISKLETGNKINLIGPLGNGFNYENKKSMIIGCGVGIAPILFLSKKLNQEKINYSAIICSQTNFNLEKDFNNRCTVITEDSTSELSGRLDNYLEKFINQENPEKLYICGPNPAMKYVAETCQKYQIPVEVAMEREFACGTGVCMGCTIELIQNEEKVQKRICKDGPVFKGEQVIW